MYGQEVIHNTTPPNIHRIIGRCRRGDGEHVCDGNENICNTAPQTCYRRGGMPDVIAK